MRSGYGRGDCSGKGGGKTRASREVGEEAMRLPVKHLALAVTDYKIWPCRKILI